MKILVVGAFDFVNFDSGGQPVKTRELYYALQNIYSYENLSYFETEGWKKSLLKKILQLIALVRSSDAIIMLPAINGVKLLTPLLLLARKKNTKLFYSVIGGWLFTELKNKPLLTSMLKMFNGIWVETSSMKIALEGMGFENISIVKNFKNLNIVKNNELSNEYVYPLKLCTFSRILEKKGIEEAIKAVCNINNKENNTLLTLDIYGPIDETYTERFTKMQKEFPEYIRYMGEKKPNESVEVLRKYFALLFPTKFYTEGIPGTLIDAYSSGVPVITSLWMNAGDIFKDGVTGYGYEFGNYNQFESILERIAHNPNLICKLRHNCIEMARSCAPEMVIKDIQKLLGY